MIILLIKNHTIPKLMNGSVISASEFICSSPVYVKVNMSIELLFVPAGVLPGFFSVRAEWSHQASLA